MTKVEFLERDCIACPASWKGKTDKNENIYIRYRGGTFQVRVGDEEYPKDIKDTLNLGGRFDGHLNRFEMEDIITNLGYEIDKSENMTFYGLSVDECEFSMIGDWFDVMYCTKCSWRMEEGEQEVVEYETVVPKFCPECKSEIELETSTPERLKKLFEE